MGIQTSLNNYSIFRMLVYETELLLQKRYRRAPRSKARIFFSIPRLKFLEM